MKNFFSLFGALTLFALTWAASHDIASGEPDVWMEWSMLVVAALVSTLVLIQIFMRKQVFHSK